MWRLIIVSLLLTALVFKTYKAVFFIVAAIYVTGVIWLGIKLGKLDLDKDYSERNDNG